MDEVSKLKVEIFDILVQMDELQIKRNRLEQVKNNKLKELQEMIKNQDVKPSSN